MIFRLFSSSKTSSLRKQAARDPADMQSRIELAQRLEQEADDTPRFAADYGEPSAKQKYKAALEAYGEACVLRLQVVKLRLNDTAALKAAAVALEKYGALNEFCGDIENAMQSYGSMFNIYHGMLDRNPDDAQTRIYLARSYAAFSGKFESGEAVSLLQKARQLLDPLVAAGVRDATTVADDIEAKLDRLGAAPSRPEPAPRATPQAVFKEEAAVSDFATPDGFTLPLRTFDGLVKQHAFNEIPVLLTLFDLAFPGFRARADFAEPGADADGWVGTDMSGKLRRYGGGPTLPRGRYFGVCKPDGSDGGGVAREIFAYARPSQTGVVLIDDMFDADKVAAANVRYGTHFEQGPYFLLHLREPERFGHAPQAAANAGYALNGLGFFRVPYTVRPLRLEKVLDLRFIRPAVACHEIFSQADVVNIVCQMPPTANFSQFLVLLLGQHRGGNQLTTAIGRELRRWGVGGLVYPSARCDCAVQYTDGALTDWHGWNLVSYAGIPRDDAVFVDELISIQSGANLKSGQEFFGAPVDAMQFHGASEGPHHGSWQVFGLAELNKQRWLAEVGADTGAPAEKGKPRAPSSPKKKAFAPTDTPVTARPEEFRAGPDWFYVAGSGQCLDIRCPRCSWQNVWDRGEEQAPKRCPQCGFDAEAKRREDEELYENLDRLYPPREPS